MDSHADIVNELRWKKFPVLNDGFVCLVDVMGDDSSVVQAARVSYGEGTKKVSDDRTLIRYLLRHRHTTPFEMAEIKFLVRVPMDCWRQWIRHRTANVNEYSTRYSLAIDATQATPPGEWRTQAESNRQGSGDPLPTDLGEQLTASEREFQENARKLYQHRIDAGVAREQARKDLPLCTYTEAYWKIDLHNLLQFPLAPDGFARSAGDSRLRDLDRRKYRQTAVPRGLGGVSGLPHGGDVSHPARPGRDLATDRPRSRNRGCSPLLHRGFSGRSGRNVAGAQAIPRTGRMPGETGPARFVGGRSSEVTGV
jgi:flavin-dependent thymidylate synthase